MKKLLALLLAAAMTLALCACGSPNENEDEEDHTSAVKRAVQAKAAVECMFSYQNVKNVLAHCSTIDDNGDGDYEVYGKVTVYDAFGDQYEGKFEADVTVDESGDAKCTSISIETPKKK